jgi:hypothetical protein
LQKIPPSATKDIQQNLLKKIRDPTTCPPFEATTLVQNHMTSLTKLSIQKINVLDGLNTIKCLWKLIGEDLEAVEAELSVLEGQW